MCLERLCPIEGKLFEIIRKYMENRKLKKDGKCKGKKGFFLYSLVGLNDNLFSEISYYLVIYNMDVLGLIPKIF